MDMPVIEIKKPKNLKGIIIFLIILLFISLVYISNNEFVSYKNNIFEQGKVAGINQTMIVIIQSAVNCQKIPLPITNNLTINLIAMECLQQK